MKIYKVFVSLTAKGWKSSISEPIEMIETDKMYVKKGMRINKKDLGKRQTTAHEYPSIYIYYSYCLSEDTAKTEEKLKHWIASRLAYDISTMNHLEQFL